MDRPLQSPVEEFEGATEKIYNGPFLTAIAFQSPAMCFTEDHSKVVPFVWFGSVELVCLRKRKEIKGSVI